MAAHARHHDIAEHDIEIAFADESECLLARSGERDRMTKLTQQGFGEMTDLLILNNSRSLHALTPPTHQAPAAGSSLIDDVVPLVRRMNSFRSKNEHFPTSARCACCSCCKLARRIGELIEKSLRR